MRIRRGISWAVVPEALMVTRDGRRRTGRPDISDRAVRLYATLWCLADRDTDTTDVPKSVLATALNCSASSIDRALRQLVASGYVTVSHRVSESGDPDSNEYTLHTSPVTQGGVTADPTRPITDEGTVPPPVTPSIKNPPRTLHTHAGFNIDTVAETWATITGTIYTRLIQKQWAPAIQAFIQAGGEPDKPFLTAAHRQGIRHPSGWPYVKQEEHRHIWYVARDDDGTVHERCQTCNDRRARSS